MTRLCWATMLAVAMVVAPAAQDRRLPDSGTQPGRRMALVIGNDTYPGSPLRNARNDATAVTSALRELGFTVTQVADANRSAFGQALSVFAGGLRAEDVAFFFFAGHGVQVEGENFLIPVDFGSDTSDIAIRVNAIRASEVQQALGRARVSVLVLDACRTNPYGGKRAASGGLAPIEAQGSLVAYATGANQTASDNPSGANGLFTGELVRLLRTPGLSIREMFYQIRQRVFDQSGGRQFPAVYDQLLRDVVLQPVAGAPKTDINTVAPLSSDTALRAELALWDVVKASADPAVFDDFVRRYPSSQFRSFAESRAAELRRPPAATNAAAPPAAASNSARVFVLTAKDVPAQSALDFAAGRFGATVILHTGDDSNIAYASDAIILASLDSSPTARAVSRIAFVDLQKVVTDSVLGKAGKSQMLALSQSVQNRLDALTKNNRTVSPTEWTTARDRGQAEVDALNTKLLAGFQDAALPLIADLAKRGDIDLVLALGDNSNIAAADAALDITAAVTAGLDAAQAKRPLTSLAPRIAESRLLLTVDLQRVVAGSKLGQKGHDQMVALAQRGGTKAEQDALNQKLLESFQAVVLPVVERIRGRRGASFVFARGDNDSIAWSQPANDISDAVIAELDAAGGVAFVVDLLPPWRFAPLN